jgi:hypothetical protein
VPALRTQPADARIIRWAVDVDPSAI